MALIVGVMSVDRRKEIVRHLSEADLDSLLAESTDEKMTQRLIFIKRLYRGATLEDAADDVGKSSPTGTRWARRWNKGGLGQLMPNFGGGPPPKLGDEERDELLELLRLANPGKNRRYITLSTKNSTLNFILFISLCSWMSLASHMQFHGQNVHHDQTTLKRSSTNQRSGSMHLPVRAC